MPRVPWILLLALCAASCAPQKDPYVQDLIGIDVSESFKNDLISSKAKVVDAVMDTAGDDLLVFVFASTSHEVYSGPRPPKDRDLSALIDQAVAKSEGVQWQLGTDMPAMLLFLSKRIQSRSRITLVTDGHFESSDGTRVKSLVTSLEKKGLIGIDFIGVRLDNKEKIYGWLEGTGVAVRFIS